VTTGGTDLPPTGVATTSPQLPDRSRAPAVAIACAAGCLVLAAVSWVVWPSSIGYDPTTWAVWGRELAHGRLAIGPGDAVFKPWPVAVDAVLAAVHAPVLQSWAVLVRAGTAGALLAAFLLGRRAVGTAAGVCAALALAAVPRFLVWYTAATTVEVLEAAALLAAVACIARGRPAGTVLWLALLSGLRPEGWPLLLLAAAWAVRRRPRAALWVTPLVLVAIGGWFVAEYVGSGRWTTGVARAGTPSLGGALLTPVPGWTVVREAYASLPPSWWLAALVTLGGSLVLVTRRRRAGVVGVPLVLGAVGVLWLAVVAVSTQLGLSAGEPRYLVGTTVCGAVLAALGAGVVVRTVAGRLGGRPVAVPLATVLATALVAYGGVRALEQGRSEAPELARRYGEQTDLARVLATADGVRDCAGVATAPDQVPAVAWTLGRPLAAVGLWPAAGSAWIVPSTVPVPDDLRGDLRYRDAHWWLAGACG